MNAPLHGPQETRFYPVVHVAQTGSTNHDVLVEAQRGASEGFTLIADYQTNGRGRFDRSWFAARCDSLLLSVLVRPALELVPVMPLLAGLAVQETIQRLIQPYDPSVVGLKWPNDVTIIDRSNAKIAGILVEAAVGGSTTAVVIGIGINVEFSEPLPEEIAGQAVSVADVAERHPTRQLALTSLLRSLERWLVLAEESGPDVVVKKYETRCTTIGRTITFADSNGSERTGRASGVDSTGGLLVATPAGVQTVLSSDIYHIGLMD